MLTVLGSDKGSPGTTTAALAVAATWPRRCTYVEADPAGGDLALRWRRAGDAALPAQPTILSLASASAMSGTRVIDAHAVALDDQLSVVPGVLTAEQLTGVRHAWAALAETLRDADTDVVCDVGRIWRDSPAWALVRAAHQVVLVGPADLGGVVRLRDRLADVTAGLAEECEHRPRTTAAITAPRRHLRRAVDDVRHLLGATAAGAVVNGVAGVPWDIRAVGHLYTGDLARVRRSRFGRTVAELTHRLAESTTEVPA